MHMLHLMHSFVQNHTGRFNATMTSKKHCAVSNGNNKASMLKWIISFDSDYSVVGRMQFFMV